MTEDSHTLETDENFAALSPIADTKVPPGVGIGAIALNFALKYHGINTVQDGALYQQYKIEGRNMHTLQLSDVFETAMQMELHLLGSSDRIAKIVIETIAAVETNDEPGSSDDPDKPDPHGVSSS